MVKDKKPNNVGKVYRGKTKYIDKDVFPEERERFKLGSHNTARVLRHTNSKRKRSKWRTYL